MQEAGWRWTGLLIAKPVVFSFSLSMHEHIYIYLHIHPLPAQTSRSGVFLMSLQHFLKGLEFGGCPTEPLLSVSAVDEDVGLGVMKG